MKSVAMTIAVAPNAPHETLADWLVVLLTDQDPLSSEVRRIDEATGNVISSVRARGDFQASAEETATLFQVRGIPAANLVLASVGAVDQIDRRTVRKALLAALRICCKTEEQTVAVAFDDSIVESVGIRQLTETTAESLTCAPVDADIYKAENARHPFSSAQICLPPDTPGIRTAIDSGVIIGEAVWLVKDLVNRTADDLYPETFADEARSLAGEHQLQVTVFDEAQLREERMGAMLGVARGSSKAPRMVRLSYRGRPGAPVLGIAGKGVTFDSGGYSLKPSDSMVAMKSDMAGAATALGTIVAAARLQLPVNVNVYLGLVENMISGDAYRLGDVLTARNGTTIEIHNTDAEGRLVLADVLAYAVDDGVDRLVDMATLTGACVVALGEEITGAFPNNDRLVSELRNAAGTVGEYLWEMPMHRHFEPLLKSSVADCKNVGPRWGGAVTAAKFLQKFVGETPWVHLDIAGPSWADAGNASQDSGGTADPVRSLIQWLRDVAG